MITQLRFFDHCIGVAECSLGHYAMVDGTPGLLAICINSNPIFFI
jgi:hypothetical protein